jgi:hypothetical protein
MSGASQSVPQLADHATQIAFFSGYRVAKLRIRIKPPSFLRHMNEAQPWPMAWRQSLVKILFPVEYFC